MTIPTTYKILTLDNFNSFFLADQKKVRHHRYLNIRPIDEVYMAHLEDICPSLTSSSKTYIQDMYILYIVREGMIEKVNQTHMVTLRKNEIFYTRPGEMNSWKIIKDVSGFVIAFTKDFIVSYLENKDFIKRLSFLGQEVAPKFDLNLMQIPFNYKKLSNYYNYLKVNPSESKDLIRLWICELLIQTEMFYVTLTGNIFKSKTKKGTYSTIIVYNYKELIESHFLEGCRNKFIPSKRVKEYASDLHLNANYLNDVVREVTGKKASELIFDRTLLTAKSKLLHTSLTISEISYFLDFNSSSYFVRFFKSRMGMTPNQYRMRMKS
ncbi:helix-turn-helix domain-containing protein [uncultured Aquimarina sp.]|uniref:helix-turn-helix domain-containing protein n=1 Tax=uncultured Aquimarina sp. TaxID=575652 RepID=UPI00261956CA|nr:helix-turn-helix domain-containing protein [uncultured Aquimarina sp.]